MSSTMKIIIMSDHSHCFMSFPNFRRTSWWRSHPLPAAAQGSRRSLPAGRLWGPSTDSVGWTCPEPHAPGQTAPKWRRPEMDPMGNSRFFLSNGKHDHVFFEVKSSRNWELSMANCESVCSNDILRWFGGPKGSIDFNMLEKLQDTVAKLELG